MFPNSGLKASPHIESCVKTLKRQFNVIMDMLTHGSRFSRDNEKKMILCDQVIFEGWININIQFFLSCIFLTYPFCKFLFHNMMHWYVLLLSIYYVFYMPECHLYLYQMHEWCLLLLFTNFS